MITNLWLNKSHGHQFRFWTRFAGLELCVSWRRHIPGSTRAARLGAALVVACRCDKTVGTLHLLIIFLISGLYTFRDGFTRYLCTSPAFRSAPSPDSAALHPGYSGFTRCQQQHTRSPDGAMRNPGIPERALPGFRCASSRLLGVHSLPATTHP